MSINTVEQWKQEKHPLEVVEDVKQYAKKGLSFEEIEKREGEGEWERLKWAGLYTHGHHEGYFMFRTKVPGGFLTPDQAIVIGEVAKKYATAPEKFGGEKQNEIWGDGFLDITTRQDTQMHWIELEDVPEIWEKYGNEELTSIQGCGDSARNVLGCPAAGLNHHECFNAQPVIDAVSDFFTDNEEYANLPRKFKISITGCKDDCAQSQINDVGLTPAKKKIEDGWKYGFHLKIGGGLSDGPRMASKIDVFVLPGDTVELCRSIAQTFKEIGDRHNRGVCRMRYLVEQIGEKKFEKAIKDRCTVDLFSRGVDLTERYTGDHVGVHKQKQENLRYIGFNVITGRIGGEDFINVGKAAKKYGTENTSIRLSTAQNFLITHIPKENVQDILKQEFTEKYRANPGPFSRGAVGCTGSEFCNYGIIETKKRTKRWARKLDKKIDVPEDLEVIRMHMSGCSASCAQPQIADIGFRGETVKIEDTTKEDDIVEGMDFGLGGSLGLDNEFLDWIENAVPAKSVIPAIEKLFEVFTDERRKGERFYEWTRRTENNRLRNIMKKADTKVSEGIAYDR